MAGWWSRARYSRCLALPRKSASLTFGRARSASSRLYSVRRSAFCRRRLFSMRRRVGIGLDAHGHHAGRAQRVPDGEAVLIAHMQFPALLADIGDAEGIDILAGDPDRLDGGEGEVARRQAGRVLDDLLQRRAGVRPPDADGDVFLGHVGDGDVEALVLGHPAHVVEIARAGIGAVDHAAAVGHADDGEVGAHHAFVVEEVGVDALADHWRRRRSSPRRAIPSARRDPGLRRRSMAKCDRLMMPQSSLMRELLGIGDAPEMAVVPFVLAHAARGCRISSSRCSLAA